jgi:hypothetical protein
MKVVINACYGGFGISKEAAEFMAERGNEEAQKMLDEYARPLDPNCKWDAINIEYGKGRDWFGSMDTTKRDDPTLVLAVESLGSAADGEFASLKVVEIPDGIDYEISEYDGYEHIAESHRTWG